MTELLEPLYTAAEMRAVEELYPGYPETAQELQERAGEAVAREAMRAFPRARRFAVVCGAGSNGGRRQGRGARAVGERPRGGRDDGAGGLRRRRRRAVRHWLPRRASTRGGGADRADERERGADRRGRSSLRRRRLDRRVAGAVVDASLTVTFHGRKVGLTVGPGRFHAGRIVVADIGLERRDTVAARANEGLLRLVPRRAPRDSKYTAGSVSSSGARRA